MNAITNYEHLWKITIRLIIDTFNLLRTVKPHL